MASGKVAAAPVAAAIAEILNSPEVGELIAELDELRWTGRRGYGARALLGACIVKTLYAIPVWTRVVALIADHPGLVDALGGTPSHWACYRFSTKLRKNRAPLAACLNALAASLRAQHPTMGQDIAIDASDLPAYANGQRYLYKGGPERKVYSDPDASWGHRSAVSTRKGGGFYGYKLHAAVCMTTGLPLAWRVETARHHESQFAIDLLDATYDRGFSPNIAVLDKGYDTNEIYAECIKRECAPVIPLEERTHRSRRPADAQHRPVAQPLPSPLGG